MPAFCAVAYVNLHWRWQRGGEFDQAALAACFHCQMRTMLDKELRENARSETSLRCPILTLGPMPPWPGVRRGMLKDKSKFSRFIHLMGMHLIGVHLMGVHLIGV